MLKSLWAGQWPGAVLSLAGVLSLGASILAGPAAAQLNIYNWTDYIAEDTISGFEKETGLKVKYDLFDSNELLQTKLLAGSTGYDLVVPSGGFLERQIKANIFLKLDRSKIPNWKNLDPGLMKQIEAHDPGNQFAVPYLWGTTGLGYDKKKILARMPDAPLDSWRLLLDPNISEKFKDCGIAVLDAPTEVLQVTLKFLGLDPYTTREADMRRASDLLLRIRPNVRYFHASQYINDLANGDISQARARAEEAKKDVDLAYVIPSEGTLLWFDLMAIPADAKNVDAAHKFIDYVLRPEVHAAITNFVAYANANAASTKLVKPEILDDPSIYPPPGVMARLFPDKVVPPAVDRLRNRIWTRVKTGR